MVAASTAFSPSSTMTASLVESTGLPSAAIPVHEDGNNGNGDSSADGSGDDGGMVRSLSLWNYFTMGFGAIIGTVWVLLVGDWMIVGRWPGRGDDRLRAGRRVSAADRLDVRRGYHGRVVSARSAGDDAALLHRFRHDSAECRRGKRRP